MELIRIDSDEERDIPDYSYFVEKGNEFEVIEDQTIDIESIKEINTSGCLVDTSTLKINQLIQAVKHLNKEIQSIKERK